MARNRVWHSLHRRRRSIHRCFESQYHNTVNSHLYKLPAELLDIITRHLTVDASIALALTCARFYLSTTLASVLKSSMAAQFKRLCILEDGRDIKGYCCRGCLRTHSSAAFAYKELQKRPAERYCLTTKNCLRLGTLTELSFADIKRILNQSKEKKPLPTFLPNNLTKLLSSPATTIETSIQVFPVRSLWITKSRFAALCISLNFPLCPHMRLGDKKVTKLFQYAVFDTSLGSRLCDKSHKCKYCKTRFTLTRSSNTVHGNEWGVLKVRRSLGRLHSPLEPTWLVHTFASRDLCLDDYCKAMNDWFEMFWTHRFNGRGEYEYLPPDSSDHLFVPNTLPTTLSSWMSSLGVQAWLITSWFVAEMIHKRYGSAHELNLPTAYG